MEMATNPAHHMVRHLAQASAAVARRSIPKVRADVVRTAGRSVTSRRTKSQYNLALLLPLSMFLELDKVILRSRAGFATCARRWSLSASGSRAWTSSQSHQGVVELDDPSLSPRLEVCRSTRPQCMSIRLYPALQVSYLQEHIADFLYSTGSALCSTALCVQKTYTLGLEVLQQRVPVEQRRRRVRRLLLRIYSTMGRRRLGSLAWRGCQVWRSECSPG